jgi:hypothetical protein
LIEWQTVLRRKTGRAAARGQIDRDGRVNVIPPKA